MRLLYATAAALAPLLLATGVQAQVVINTSRTTPVLTSNPGGTGPANLELASGGVVNVTSGAAVTVDTNNTLLIRSGGGVTMVNAANGAVGVLVNGGLTTTITIGGTIAVSDSIDLYPNPDQDTDDDGPFATGSGRYGVRIAGPITGDVELSRTASVLVEGNDSFGLSLDAGLNGDLRVLGTTRVVGDRTVGIRSAGTLNGDAFIGGGLSVLGEGAVGVRVEGDVTGRLTLQSDIAVSGYRLTTRPSETVIAALEAEDRLQGGPAVWVGANVAGGVLFDGLPTESNSASTDDDGDGVVDSDEVASRINVFGGAPAVLIGSMTQTVTLGPVGADANNFGFINRSQITAQGVYDGIDSQALRFGMDGGQAVTVAGGILNAGTTSVLAFEADATAIRIGTGVTTPRLVNTSTLTAASASENGGAVDAVLIEAGANVPTFSNSGRILAASGGGTASVTALRDLSGTLTSVTNTGSMQANLNPNADNDPITGSTTLIDVRANTSGVTVLQNGVANTPTTDDPDTDGDGVSNSAEPEMIGDILFGSGADVLDVRNGSVLGAIAFGAGADRLTISGGATVVGALSDTDGQLAVDVQNGTLDGRQTTTVNASSLDLGADGRLIVTVDGASGQAGGYNVAGTATLASGAELGVRFSSLIDGPRRFTIIDANTLNLGQLDFGATEANSPYLFRVDAGADVATGQVFVDVRRRTAAEAGLIQSEAGLFDAFYDALDRDEAVLDAFISQTERTGFANLYEQMLPEHSGGALLSLAGGVDAVTRALVGRNASAAPGEASAWLQEITFYADKDKTESQGFRSEGFGVAGGFEVGTDYGGLGISLAFTSSDLEDPESEAEEVVSASLVELGVYWRAQGQYWTTWARAAGGYASFDSTRRLVGSGLNLSNTSSWNGYTIAAAGGASYQRTFGRFAVRPEAYAEYFLLSEDGHVESGGGDAFDLELDDREGHMFSATAAINVSMGLGDGDWLRPELRVGWRQNISVDPGVTTGRFVSGGPDFMLDPGTIEGGGPILGLRLNVGNELGMLSISADAEMIDDYIRYMFLLRASFRF